MDEPAKPPNPNALRCETHNLRHGPSGCPICLRAAAPEPVVLLPVHDTSLSGLDAVADFWRRYGMRSIGLLALGIGAVYSLAWPSPTKAMDPAPYQQAIVDLESVLFYSGPTDPEAHQKVLLTLLPALVSSIQAHPPAYRAEVLIAGLEEIETRVKHADLETFRLTGPRRAWVNIRENFFDDAVWFHLRDDQLDAVQNERQGDLPRGEPDVAALDTLEAYFRTVEGFVARAGNLAAQACAAGADLAATSSEFRSLSADTTAKLEGIVAANEAAKSMLEPVISSARVLVRGRKDSPCATGVPSGGSLDRDYITFKASLERTRQRLGGTPAS